MKNSENTTATIGNIHTEQTLLNTMVNKVSNYIREKKLNIQGLEIKVISEQTTMYKVKGTPYTIVQENGVYFNLIGKVRTSQDFTTIKEALKEAKRFNIEKVMELIEIMHTARTVFNKKQ